MAICLVLLGTVSAVWQFYGYFAIGRAAVVGIVDLAVGVTIANWFIRLRGRATSVVLLGTRGGMALMPLLVLLFLTIADWRLAFVGLGVLVAVVAMLPAWLVIRRRPEDVGLLPDGGPTTAEPPAGAAVAPPRDDDPRWPVRDVVRTSAFWFLLFGTGLLFFAGGAVNLSIAPHIEDNGLSRTTAATVITVWALAGMVGGIIGGEVRQRAPLRYALPAILVLTAGGLMWLILVRATWMAYVFAVWHGLSFGAQLPLMLVAFPDYFGRWTVGAIRGIAAPVQFGLNAVGPLLASLAFDRWGTYDYVFSFFVGCYFLAGLAILFAKPPSLPAPVPGPEDARS